jgi:hypothetical protein
LGYSYWKNTLAPEIEKIQINDPEKNQKRNLKTVYISLNGITNTDDYPYLIKLFFRFGCFI